MATLQITPESELTFSLSKKEATPRCMMTLRHAGGTDESIAFKVKTTQPRRYLVRPNQGLIAPGTSETISILLVEKDKQVLLQSYERLGQSGLDHSKDKFLVQSCTVDQAFAAKKSGDSSELYDALTAMWNSVTSGGSTTPVNNKKLHVRHVVQESDGTGSSAPKLEKASYSNLKDMKADQLATELSGLRRKYDELVSFSVNLTAERDILSNTLEQTKRDYNREMAARSALENKQGGGSSRGGAGKGGKSGGASMFQLIFIGLACFLAGAKIGATGNAPYLPVVGNFFVVESDASPVDAAKVDAPVPPPTPEETASGGEL